MKRMLLVLTIIFILATGCTSKAPEEKGVLNIGLMPAVDTAPIFLAQENGYFEELNLEVNIQIFTNAQDRQSALQTGSIDGAMTDLVALATNVNGGFQMKATTLTDGMFILLANEGAKDKTEIKVGMMEISVSNFLVDQWLSEYDVEKVYINAIPGRLEAVVTNQLDMGLLPEPIASVGVLQGLEKIVYEPVDGFSPDVMAFTQKTIDEKSNALLAFHKAYNKAVKDLQADENLAREVIIGNIPNMNEKLKDMMNLPTYHEARLPDDAYLNKIIEWTNGVIGETMNVSADDLIDKQFVNK